jgi:hypothetical protein
LQLIVLVAHCVDRDAASIHGLGELPNHEVVGDLEASDDHDAMMQGEMVVALAQAG